MGKIRPIKFRAWDAHKQAMNYRVLCGSTDTKDINWVCPSMWQESKKDWVNFDDVGNIMQFTGFTDSKGKEIFEGDIIGDWTETDEGKIQSKCQVFWSYKTGSWQMDQSLAQDKSNGVDLWLELIDFKYEVLGDIHTQLK